MATVCDYCGHKTNEVKSGGGIEEKGTKITLRVTDPSDLTRDVLKVRLVHIYVTSSRDIKADRFNFFLWGSFYVP